jgi:hypothetical protein
MVASCKKDPPPIEAEARPTAIPSSAPTAAPETSSIARAIVDEAPPPQISEKTLTLSLLDGDPTLSGGVNDEKRIFAVGDKLIVTPSFAVLKEGALVKPEEGYQPEDFPGEAPEFAPQHAVWITFQSVMGRYPDDLWVDATGTFGMVTPRQNFTAENAYTYQRQFGRWGRVKDHPVAAAPWTKGRTLAYLTTREFKLAQPRKGTLGELPRQAAGEGCPQRVSGLAMAVSAEGGIALLGTDCERPRKLAIERWEADSGEALAQSRVLPLPTPDDGWPAAAWIFERAGVVYAMANYFKRAWLAEIRGDSIKEIKLPVTKIEAAHAAADGSLFFLANDGVIYRYDGLLGEGPAFTRAAIPAKYAPKSITGIAAESRDLLYATVVTEAKDASLLLWSKPTPPAVEEAVARAEQRASDKSPPAGATATVSPEELLAMFPALTAECRTPFVTFFPVSRSTPANFNFPQTQRIIKEFPGREALRVIDFEYRSARFVGAVAPDIKVAEALVEHWNKRDEKSKSRAACFPPPDGVRTVTIP